MKAKSNHEGTESVHLWVAGISWAILSLSGILYIFALPEISVGVKTISFLVFALLIGLYLGQTIPNIHRQAISKVADPFKLSSIFVAFLFLIYVLYAILVQAISSAQLLVGLVYLAIPVVLAILVRSRPLKLTVLDALLILAIWFPIEFGWLPKLSIPPSNGMANVYHLFGIILAIFIFRAVRQIPDMGLQLKMTGRHAWLALAMATIFMIVFALPIGLTTGFIGFGLKQESALKFIGGILGTAFFIALPEEILFRGIIQNLIEKSMPQKRQLALIIASIIFGLAHADNHNPPFVKLSLGFLGTFMLPWVYVVLATIAGWFYGKTYQKTGNVAAAALVHTLVDCTWWIFFGNV